MYTVGNLYFKQSFLFYEVQYLQIFYYQLIPVFFQQFIFYLLKNEKIFILCCFKLKIIKRALIEKYTLWRGLQNQSHIKY